VEEGIIETFSFSRRRDKFKICFEAMQDGMDYIELFSKPIRMNAGGARRQGRRLAKRSSIAAIRAMNRISSVRPLEMRRSRATAAR
jgi:hypothetical protein